MRSIRYFGNGTLKMVEAPEPEIKRADEVKIRVAYCGVCGSDLHFKRAELDFLFEGDGGYPHRPRGDRRDHRARPGSDL